MEVLKTPKVEKLVKYAVISGFLQREKEAPPLSLMLVAPPESNKTTILKQFDGMKNVFYTVDISSKPLIDFLKKAALEKYHHIIIPDFIKVVSHNRNTVSAVVTTMNAMMEEGIRSSIFYGQEIDLKNNVKCGIITSITPKLYKEQFKTWNDIGFLTRFLTVSYEYSEETRLEIMRLISGDGLAPLDEELSKIRKAGKKSISINNDISNGIMLYTDELVKKLKTFYVTSYYNNSPKKIFLDIQGFRLLKQMRLLSMAIAFERGLDAVNYECLTELKDLIDYIRMPDNPKTL
jgi:hypothetical protein